jgi:hypothetical protein
MLLGTMMLATAVVARPADAQPAPTPTPVDVWKLIEGEAPEGTTFSVEFDCAVEPDGVVVEISFDGEGTETVPLPNGVECTVSEPEDGGADRVEIEPETFVPDNTGERLTVTVTNYFDADPLAAEVPLPVELAPNFTG